MRAAMVAEQQRLIATGPYAPKAATSRTVVAPTSLKVFHRLPGSEGSSAGRPDRQPVAEAVLAAQEERDRRDPERGTEPSMPPKTRMTIDSSGMSADQVIAEIAALARDRGLA